MNAGEGLGSKLHDSSTISHRVGDSVKTSDEHEAMANGKLLLPIWINISPTTYGAKKMNLLTTITI